MNDHLTHHAATPPPTPEPDHEHWWTSDDAMRVHFLDEHQEQS